MRSDGTGTMDYIIEFLVNVIPNLLRYQIMDALENPAKAKIQEAMNQINVEQLIKEKVNEYEQNDGKVSFNLNILNWIYWIPQRGDNQNESTRPS